MNHKQKLGYMLLGAGILAVGIIIGQAVTPDIEAQSNGVFDKIQCRELVVADAKNNPAIHLTSDADGNAITVFNNQGKGPSAIITSMEDGNGILVYDRHGKVAVNVVSIKEGNWMEVLDKQGNIRWRAP